MIVNDEPIYINIITIKADNKQYTDNKQVIVFMLHPKGQMVEQPLSTVTVFHN